MHIEINNRGNTFFLSGAKQNLDKAEKIIEYLYNQTESGELLTPQKIHLCLKESDTQHANNGDDQNISTLQLKISAIKARGKNQGQYLDNILHHDINFAIGPAGTGKTYLAVACAIHHLDQERVQRIILVRPAVEAGEQLGFLPGDMIEKVDPYLRPMYDALYEMLSPERVVKLLERNIIEVAPLAFMRGRTLNDAFIILDEAQNTTKEQMKMFLTRIGFGSVAVITGDTTQIDLPKHTTSGLIHSEELLQNIKGISFNYFTSDDVVRHTLVQRIVEAYEAEDKKHSK